MSSHISIIFPVPQMEQIIQDYRFKFDFFAKKGIPSHITLIYNIQTNVFKKHKDEILCLLRAAIKHLSDKKIVAKNIKRNEKSLYIKLANNDVDYLKAIQTLLFEYLKPNQIKMYKTYYDEPHITIFTGKNNPGWKIENKITDDVKSKLPKKINLNKIWIIEINKKKNTADILYSIKK